MPATLPALTPLRFPLNHTIGSLFAQIGGFSLMGALVQNGAPRGAVMQRFPDGAPTDLEVRGDEARWNPDTREVDYTVGVEFPVNGTRGEDWRMVIAYEPCDTYSAWLTAVENGFRRPIGTMRDLYGDNLNAAVIDAYDRAIKARNGGFIPLG